MAHRFRRREGPVRCHHHGRVSNRMGMAPVTDQLGGAFRLRSFPGRNAAAHVPIVVILVEDLDERRRRRRRSRPLLPRRQTSQVSYRVRPIANGGISRKSDGEKANQSIHRSPRLAPFLGCLCLELNGPGGVTEVDQLGYGHVQPAPDDQETLVALRYATGPPRPTSAGGGCRRSRRRGPIRERVRERGRTDRR